MMSASSSRDVLADFHPPVRQALVEAAEALGATPPAEPRIAASVVLLRDGAAGLEVYLLHRHARMSFAASMVVFPGGGLDPIDSASPDPVLACALRETQEETGVRLQAADLRPWAHWITPVPEPRRYDTHFFVAGLPGGQEPADVSGETDSAGWSTPAAALSAYAAGTLALMPPTLSILTELAALADLDAVVRAADGREVVAVLPELVRGADGWSYRYPEQA